jgi:hypothetical protein
MRNIAVCSRWQIYVATGHGFYPLDRQLLLKRHSDNYFARGAGGWRQEDDLPRSNFLI